MKTGLSLIASFSRYWLIEATAAVAHGCIWHRPHRSLRVACFRARTSQPATRVIVISRSPAETVGSPHTTSSDRHVETTEWECGAHAITTDRLDVRLLSNQRLRVSLSF